MLRNAKIPARYVEGYRIRSDQWRLGKAQVTDYEAHAWVEVYLEHIGWVPVDVTGVSTGKTAYERTEKAEKQQNACLLYTSMSKQVTSFQNITLTRQSMIIVYLTAKALQIHL